MKLAKADPSPRVRIRVSSKKSENVKNLKEGAKGGYPRILEGKNIINGPG